MICRGNVNKTVEGDGCVVYNKHISTGKCLHNVYNKRT